MKKAVLFIIFNRLDSTQKVLEQIRLAKPERLYIASDGGREDRENEKEAVEEVRKWVVENIDWPCEVKTFFRDENVGLKKNISGAINWFFEQEPDGIILEDDCVPSQSFFPYCEELLDKYKDDKRIWHIAGDNPLDIYENGASYYFAQIEHCWGWATWADRWQQFRLDMPDFDEDIEKIKNVLPNKMVKKYWVKIFKDCKKDKINSWAYIWTYTILKNNGFCINPSKNLVSNIGFDGEHFLDKDKNPLLNMPTYEIEKIVHPKKIEFDKDAINLIYKKGFFIELSWLKAVFKYIKKYPFFFFRKDFWNKV